MKPIRRGQIVKFHTPFEYEDPNQLFIILEFIEDGDRSRATVQAIQTESSMQSTHLIRVKDLEVEEGQTFELDYYLEHGKHDLF